MYFTDQERIQKVYNAMADEMSRDIFVNRFFYSMTKDDRFINAIVGKYVNKNGMNPNGEIYYLLHGIENFHSNKLLIVYGCGEIGEKINHKLGDLVAAFCDKDLKKQQQGFCGKKVYSPEDILEQKDKFTVLIGSTLYYEEIYKWIKNNSISLALDNLNLMKHWKNLVQSQYFDHDIIKFDQDEVFIDGGSLNYFTARQFLEECQTVKKIYAFEPEPECARRCELEAQKLRTHNYEIIEKGLYHEDTILCFKKMDGGESSIDTEGDLKVTVCSLDNQIKDRVTFIKLDIEGSELAALQGAEHLIKQNCPKLAVCVYHKAQDILEIPDYILDLNPHYKLYLRHYSEYDTETVLYAVP